MDIEYFSFSKCKEGEKEDGNRDAFYPLILKKSLKYPKIIISDGASQSYLSGEWAQFLVKKLGESKIIKFNRIKKKFFFKSFYKDTELNLKWESRVKDYISERNTRENPLKWYEVVVIQSGADATLLGVIITTTDNSWEACAIGDTCLFFIHEDILKSKFPIESSEDFNNITPLISTI